ncbi:sugar phosphate isomerase/epimerase family protein [Microbacterium sp. RD1]|uniref:sugar phosphate isomerase/epimerase family protein n=1 Tax=Microbacterium sp. RD1 TaxID=3457313 RepID=UPI003FA5F902
MAELRLGVSLHSFAHEYCSYVWSLEDLLAMAGQLGGGVEIVGPSHQRGFPYVTDEFEAVFRSAVDRHGLTPTSYGSYADPFLLPHRDLTLDELLEYTIPQLRGAARLGFPVVRLQHYTASIIDRLLPEADDLDIVLGWELHVPMTLASDRTRRLLDLVEKYDTPRLGIIPDAGIFARSVSVAHVRRARELGVSEDVIRRVLAAWRDDRDLDEAHQLLGNPGPTSPVTTWAGLVWDTFGRSDPAELDAVIHRVVHVHGKFFDIVDGDEPDIRYRDLVAALVRTDYTGWVSSEYEGAVGIGEGGGARAQRDSFELVAAHHRMIRRYERDAS